MLLRQWRLSSHSRNRNWEHEHDWPWALQPVRTTGCANLGLQKKLVPEACPRDADAKGLEWVWETDISNCNPGDSDAGRPRTTL